MHEAYGLPQTGMFSLFCGGGLTGKEHHAGGEEAWFAGHVQTFLSESSRASEAVSVCTCLATECARTQRSAIELPVLSFKYRPSLVLTGSAQAHLDTIKV